RSTARRRSAAPLADGPPFPPLPAMAPSILAFGWGGTSALAGAQVIAMDDDLRSVVGARSGVLVLKVAEGTPASASGLRAGDVIVLADGSAVETPGALQRALLRAGTERSVLLKVARRGRTR